MDSNGNSNEVIHKNTLTTFNLPNIQDIKKEICDDDLTTRLDKYDDFAFEPFHENFFRTLSSNFDNQSNISEINEACLKLEKCFIENNILNKNGLTKFNFKGSAMFLKYRDIDDAFEDMVISESAGKRRTSDFALKRIDLKPFKDTFLSLDLNESLPADYEDAQSRNDSDLEAVDQSESHIELSPSEYCATDGEFSDVDETNVLSENLIGYIKSQFNTEHVKLETSNESFLNSNNTADTDNPDTLECNENPLKDTIRDIRIVVEKLPPSVSEEVINIEDDDEVEVTVVPQEPASKVIRQVARKKTGGMVINRSISLSNDEIHKEQKNNSHSTKDCEPINHVPNEFDKMTRAGKRDLERVLAESTANLVIQKTTQLISEKIKELQTNEKDSDGSASEDESRESDIHKTAEIVTNTIIEFLTKNKGKKLDKLGKDISEEITNKVNSLGISLEGTNVKEPASEPPAESSTKLNNSIEQKTENSIEVLNINKSNEKCEDSSKKVIQNHVRPSPPKKKSTRRNAAFGNSRKTLAEQFEEIAKIERDIINCELTTPLILDEHEEPKKPSRQSLTKPEKEVTLNNENNEPRRPFTRQSVAKAEKDVIFIGEVSKKPATSKPASKVDCDIIIVDDQPEEIKRYSTRQSVPKANGKDANSDLVKPSLVYEPRRPTTRQSSKKQQEGAGVSTTGVVQDKVLTTAAASKRKSNPKPKQTATRRSLRRQSSNNAKLDNEVTATDEFSGESQISIDVEANEDSVSLSDSDVSKSSKTFDTPVVSHGAILKVTADSTTSENDLITNSNDQDDNDENNQFSESNLPDNTEVVSTDPDIISNSNSDNANVEVHSLTANSKHYQVDKNNVDSAKNEAETLTCYSNKVDSLPGDSSPKDINSVEHKESLHLKGVSKLMEDVLDETMKENFNLTKDIINNRINPSITEKSPISKFTNELLCSTNDKPTSQSVDEPFQILNDMITDIEEKLLQQENEIKQNNNDRKTDLNKLDTSLASTQDLDAQFIADSTSFLNDIDDSFKLIIDEDAPKEEVNLPESISVIPSVLSPDKKRVEAKQHNATCGDIDLREETTNEHKDLCHVEKSDEEKTKSKQKMEKEAISSDNQDTKMNQNKIEKLDTTSTDNKPAVPQKTLTNEEKIVKLTRRDPRLVNEKKKVTVLLRDPRIRNKLPNIEDKRENPIIEKVLVSKVLEKRENPNNKKSSKAGEIIAVNIMDKVTNSKASEKKPLLVETLEKEPISSKTFEDRKNLPRRVSEANSKVQDKSELLGDQKTSGSKATGSEVLVVPSASDPATVVPINSSSVPTSIEDDAKESSQSSKTEIVDSDLNRKKKNKKTVDEELLYKTPLSDLHDAHSDRPTYDRAIKKKRTFPPPRKVRDGNEERDRASVHRRNRTYEESNDRRGYKQLPHDGQKPNGFFRRDSFEERNFISPNDDAGGPHHRLDHREYFGEEEKKFPYDDRNSYQEREPNFPSGSRDNFEPETYARRMVNEGNFSGMNHDRNDFQDNHIYSRREFFRRNRNAYDHDHFGSSSGMVENPNIPQQENQFYSQQNTFAVPDEPSFLASAYPPVSLLPDPMYSQEKEFDQSYGNMMDTDSFSPPLSDLVPPPPPPVIRTPSPDLVRRDNYCPSPPRIGRCESPNERNYEEYDRNFRRNFENDGRSYRGRNGGNNRIHFGNRNRGGGRERWRDESPPRKRFAGDYNRGRDDDRTGRWRRSPSWSPERRRWSRERSLSPPSHPWNSPTAPPTREIHPWNSSPTPPAQREVHPWNSSPTAPPQHPWNSPPREHPWHSPPRRRSPSPPRRRDNYRERSSYYHRY